MPRRALLISTYELGRQPFGLASPAAWLRGEGWDVSCIDTAKERIEEPIFSGVDLVAFHLPMHTATRLAGPIIATARRLNRSARICAYGLYAPLNEAWLRSLGVDDVLDGEFEADLADVARQIARDPSQASQARLSTSRPVYVHDEVDVGRKKALPRLRFLVPDRSGLPLLSRYATLDMPDGSRKVVGSTEASRGCRHVCRHCPVVPVYQGQFRVVQPDVVLADIRAQVDAGAEHITFGDPDFFNGPTHAMHIVEAMHRAHPQVTYDVTIKIEHLLQHRDLLPQLVSTACVFVTSAVESLDDRVLAILDKGHTRAGFVEAVDVCRGIGLTLVPTFVAFHPWLSLEDYCFLLDSIADLDLIDHVAPIQLAIRLLVPDGSRLLDLPDLRSRLDAFDSGTLSYRWAHADPRVDGLHRDVTALVGTRLTANRRVVFDAIHALARERAGLPAPVPSAAVPGHAVPYLSEPWYCCAEPNPDDVRIV